MSGGRYSVLVAALGLAAAVSSCRAFEAAPDGEPTPASDAGAEDALAPEPGADAGATWCTERPSSPGSATVLCDDFDQNSPTWQWSPPWDPGRIAVGDGALERVDGGLTSGARALKAEAQSSPSESSRFLLSKQNVEANSLTYAFDVRVDELVVPSNASGELIVGRVSDGTGNGSGYFEIRFKLEVGGGLRGALYHAQLDQVLDFPASTLEHGKTHRIALVIDRSNGSSFELTVDGQVAVAKTTFQLSARQFAFELGAHAGPNVRGSVRFDNVVIETY